MVATSKRWSLLVRDDRYYASCVMQKNYSINKDSNLSPVSLV